MSDAFYEAVAVWSQVIASLLFIVALAALWVKFVTPAVAASQVRKNQELADAEARRDDMRALVDVASDEVTTADADARAIAERAQRDAVRVKKRLIADATAEGERLVRNAQGELERRRSAALTNLREELIAKALDIARAAAAHGLDPAADRRLLDETLATAERGGQG